jgi:hypothetical protein
MRILPLKKDPEGFENLQGLTAERWMDSKHPLNEGARGERKESDHLESDS